MRKATSLAAIIVGLMPACSIPHRANDGSYAAGFDGGRVDVQVSKAEPISPSTSAQLPPILKTRSAEEVQAWREAYFKTVEAEIDAHGFHDESPVRPYDLRKNEFLLPHKVVKSFLNAITRPYPRETHYRQYNAPVTRNCRFMDHEPCSSVWRNWFDTTATVISSYLMTAEFKETFFELLKDDFSKEEIELFYTIFDTPGTHVEAKEFARYSSCKEQLLHRRAHEEFAKLPSADQEYLKKAGSEIVEWTVPDVDAWTGLGRPPKLCPTKSYLAQSVRFLDWGSCDVIRENGWGDELILAIISSKSFGENIERDILRCLPRAYELMWRIKEGMYKID